MRDVRLSVVTPPTVEPVTLSEIWTDLRLDPSGSPPSTYFDAELNSFITSARELAEQITRRAFVMQTLAMSFRVFPGRHAGFGTGYNSSFLSDDFIYRTGSIELRRPPVRSITSITYYDLDGVQQTLDPSLYRLVNEGTMPARVELVSDGFWPDVIVRDDAVTITYVAGYPASGSPPDYAANVPQGIKTAIKLRIRQFFNAVTPEEYDKLERAIQSLLASHTVSSF